MTGWNSHTCSDYTEGSGPPFLWVIASPYAHFIGIVRPQFMGFNQTTISEACILFAKVAGRHFGSILQFVFGVGNDGGNG